MSVINPASWVSLGIAVGCAACASNTAPRGWLPKPQEAQATAYGGWIELTYHKGQERQGTDGELIAVTAESVWVLNENQGFVIPTASVKKGKLTAYAAEKGRMATWTGLGTVATLSNGAVLILTAPMWIIGGSLATGAESRAPERQNPPLSWMALAPFARFPQGMPDGIELTALKAKEVHSQVEERP
jgi:hypothetical protein